MAFTVSLPPETEQRLRQKAAAAGRDLDTFIRETLEEKLNSPRCFAEALAPMQEAFAEHPMTEDESAVMFQRLRDEAWRERSLRLGRKG